MKKDDLIPPCRHCHYCAPRGRQNTQCGRLGRKRYYCDHPKARDMRDRHGFPIIPFVGFGDMTLKSPLVLKTRKVWCPRVQEVETNAPKS